MKHFLNGRTSLGIASLPVLSLGAFGFRDDVLIPVLFCSWLTSWLALTVGATNAKD